MITIDGSTLEGGGQLTRMALSLSAITGMPVRIHSIRAGRASRDRRSGRGQDRRDQRRHGGDGGRKNASAKTDAGSGSSAAGLKESHLAALDFLTDQCNARVEGAFVGSTEVVFRPRSRPRPHLAHSGQKNAVPSTTIPTPDQSSDRSSNSNSNSISISSKNELRNREYAIALEKSGSVWLVFQALFPYFVFAFDWSDLDTVTLVLHGGTNVSKAMTTEYMTQVFFPMAEQIGLPKVNVETITRGWAGNAPQIGEAKVVIHRPGVKNKNTLSSTARPVPDIPPFVLPAFHLTPSSPTSSSSPTIEVESIVVTLLASPVPSPRTTYIKTTLETLLKTTSFSTSSDSTSAPSITFATNPSFFSSSSDTEHETDTTDTNDPRRLYILLVAHLSNKQILGYDVLGTGRTPRTTRDFEETTNQLCRQVVSGLMKEIQAATATNTGGKITPAATGSAVDSHLQDQLIIFQALADGVSRVGNPPLPSPSSSTKNKNNDYEEKNEREYENENEDEDEDGNVIDNDDDSRVQPVTDRSGTLHTRTVRWLCDTFLRDLGVGFEQGGVCRGIAWNKVVNVKDRDGDGGIRSVLEEEEPTDRFRDRDGAVEYFESDCRWRSNQRGKDGDIVRVTRRPGRGILHHGRDHVR